MEGEKLYKKSIDDVRHHETLLFDRLNYFLVGSAFLVTAYVTLAVKLNQSPKSDPVFLLAYLIIAAGFYLSASFAVINYLNTRLIGEMQLCIKKLELGLNPHQNESANKVITEDFHSDMFCLMVGPIIGTWRFVVHPFQTKPKDTEAPHSYIIPLGFSIFWFVVLIILNLNYRNYNNFFIWRWIYLFVPLIILLVIHLLWLRLLKPLFDRCLNKNKIATTSISIGIGAPYLIYVNLKPTHLAKADKEYYVVLIEKGEKDKTKREIGRSRTTINWTKSQIDTYLDKTVTFPIKPAEETYFMKDVSHIFKIDVREPQT